ncbi:MAG: hypothetical protein S4CHLAM6_13040 [Chlamydiae bacterium]|nr:hypothetical protein [Chlamydiota bacterium]
MKKLYSLAPALLSTMPLLADSGAAVPENNLTKTISIFGIVLAFFYLILWRPEQKRRKKMKNLRDGLKSGDKITAMGIIGEIAEIKENTIVLKVEGAKIEMLKAAISEIHQPAEQAVKEEPAAEPA